MLTLSQVKQYYSEEVFRRNPKAVLVEYLQYELLDSLYKQTGSEKLSFVGGTAIRIVYNSARFSEDLDFDNFGLQFKDFEKIFRQVAADMEVKGFTIEFKFIKKGAYHCYIRFPDLLALNNLSPHKSEKILVRIDTVKKNKIFKPEISVLGSFNIYRKILVNPASIILSRKLIAILERKQDKGRDYYDVSYLLGMVKPDFSILKKEYGLDKKEIKKKILEKTKNLDMKDLTKDVLPFLINPDDAQRIISFREYIKQEL